MENISEPDSQRDQPTQDVIAQLEYILNDDYFSEINAKADVAENRLNTGMMSAQLQRQVIDELDAEWIYMKQEVAAWGPLLVPSSRHPSGTMTYQSKNMNGERLESAGFAILPFAAVCDDETIIQYKIAYAFVYNDSHAAILRESFTGDFPDSTPDMARRRLEYHYPEETARARQLAGPQDRAKDASPILNYRDYSIGFLTRAKGHNEYINDMQTYLFELMQFDRQLPYFITCELDEFDDGTDPSIVQVVASPMRIVLHSVDQNESTNPKQHIPLIVLSVYDSDKTKPNTELTVPLHTLHRFESIRHVVERGDDEKDDD